MPEWSDMETIPDNQLIATAVLAVLNQQQPEGNKAVVFTEEKTLVQLFTELAALPSPAAPAEKPFQLGYKEELQHHRSTRRNTRARMIRNRQIGNIFS